MYMFVYVLCLCCDLDGTRMYLSSLLYTVQFACSTSFFAFVLFYFFDMSFMFFFFFFSSRRRHTRCYRDWSSDVCSSDLFPEADQPVVRLDLHHGANKAPPVTSIGMTQRRCQRNTYGRGAEVFDFHTRSEERRVGKECRSWLDLDALKKSGMVHVTNNDVG